MLYRVGIVLIVLFMGLRNMAQDPVWVFPTRAPVFASPAYENGTIYIGSDNGIFYALDQQSGILKWQYKTGAGIRSTACCLDGQVYFVNASGTVFCLDMQTGRLIWKFYRPGEKQYPLYSFADYYQSSPIIQAGILYVGSGNGNLYAIDTRTGMELWHFQTGSVVHAKPVISNGRIYFGSFDGYCYALDLKGKLQWKFKSVGHRFFPTGEFQGNPVVVGSQVIIGARDYNLYALDTATGYGHWNLSFPKGWAMGQPVSQDSLVYVGTSDDHLLLAIDPMSGRIQWQSDLGFNIFGGVAAGKENLFIGTLMGHIYSIDTRSHEAKLFFSTKSSLQNRHTYFKADNSFREDIFGNLVKKNEDILQVYIHMGAIFSTPVLVNGRLICSSTDGNIYCLETVRSGVSSK